MKDNYVFLGNVYGRITFEDSSMEFFVKLPEVYFLEDLSIDLTSFEVQEIIRRNVNTSNIVYPYTLTPITRAERETLISEWEFLLDFLAVDDGTLEEDSREINQVLRIQLKNKISILL